MLNVELNNVKQFSVPNGRSVCPLFVLKKVPRRALTCLLLR